MCLAHWEALRTLLGRADPLAAQPKPLLPLPAAKVALSLAPLLDLGPPALASSAELREAFCEALRRLAPQFGASSRHQLQARGCTASALHACKLPQAGLGASVLPLHRLTIACKSDLGCPAPCARSRFCPLAQGLPGPHDSTHCGLYVCQQLVVNTCVRHYQLKQCSLPSRQPPCAG